jgi:hypothetical protein
MYNDLFSHMIKDEIDQQFYGYGYVLNNIGFLMKEKIIKTKSVLWRMHVRIDRYVSAAASTNQHRNMKNVCLHTVTTLIAKQPMIQFQRDSF